MNDGLDLCRVATNVRRMPEFTPVNSLEIRLRALLRDRNTPLWSFYTPLAAAPLWVIAKNYPELDGSDSVAPDGGNPGLCVMDFAGKPYIGLYTAQCRVEAVFEVCKISRHEWVPRSAPGYELLRFVKDIEASLWLNCGLKDCQYHLDPDMVDILLSRPEPDYNDSVPASIGVSPEEDFLRFLGPLRDFLSTQTNVRAVWIFEREAATPLPEGHHAYDISLAMRDPEDGSLLVKVGTMAKALSPVEMDWTPMAVMADDDSLRKLAKQHPPFYQAADFLKEGRESGKD